MTVSHRFARTSDGMSLIEVLVATALVALVFTGLFVALQYTVTLLGDTRSQTTALALASERIEFLRSLPYDTIGTISGIPSGSIPQNETVSLNSQTFSVRTLIQYVDSPADGSAGADSNGITADYKRAKVEVSWTRKGTSKNVTLVTNLIPKGIETVAGGGTLITNVFDATALPVTGAAVRIVNASTSPAIDVTSYTNVAGQVIFPGAPASGGYQISVSKAGYSSAQTYTASTSNPNPNPAHVAVVVSGVSTMNFAIDRTATTTVRTVEPPATYLDDDTFASATYIDLMSSTSVVAGAITLTNGPLGYPSVGDAIATATAPTNLINWNEATFTASTPPSTSFIIQVYTVNASGTRTLIADSDLPGNSTGFTTSPIDLSSLIPATHGRIALGARLTTSDASSTPEILEWGIEYDAANVPIPGITFSMRGSKSIGTDGGGAPVLKYTTTHTTDSSGESIVGNLEWDTYSLTIDGSATGYDVIDSCPRLPLSLAPDAATTTTLVLGSHVTRSLRVVVQSVGGATLSGADVRLSRGGYDTTISTSACGSAFFSNPPNASDYTLETSASGYQTDTLSGVSVSGTDTLTVILSPI